MTNNEKYFPDMEIINSDIENKILNITNNTNFEKYNEYDVINALDKNDCSIEDFCALISPVAKKFIEQIAQKAKKERERFFGKNVYFFTPLYISNYYENHCIYCGFN